MSATAEMGRTARAAQLERIGRAGYTLGAALVVVGGLVAAVTSPLALAKGSWLAAFLVLVCGVVLLAVLVTSLVETRHSAASARTVLLRVALALLIVSIPIGLVLAHARAAS